MFSPNILNINKNRWKIQNCQGRDRLFMLVANWSPNKSCKNRLVGNSVSTNIFLKWSLLSVVFFESGNTFVNNLLNVMFVFIAFSMYMENLSSILISNREMILSLLLMDKWLLITSWNNSVWYLRPIVTKVRGLIWYFQCVSLFLNENCLKWTKENTFNVTATYHLNLRHTKMYFWNQPVESEWEKVIAK